MRLDQNMICARKLGCLEGIQVGYGALNVHEVSRLLRVRSQKG